MAVTLRFQSTGLVPGNARPVTMQGPSLTIGRGDENDLVLPDPDRLISKNHCVIEDRGGDVTVIDLSTNGTFLNYGKVALGRVPAPLNDGDILTLGPYELIVEITARPGSRPVPGADLAPLDDPRVAVRKAAAGVDDLTSLLDDPSGDGGFLDDLLGGPARPGGPARVRRADPADDGLLPPLGSEADDLLAPLPDPLAGQGASQPMHNPAMNDHFMTPRPAAAAAIPDDWDDLLEGIAPGGGGADPFARAVPPPAMPPAMPPGLPEAGPDAGPMSASISPAAAPPAAVPVIPDDDLGFGDADDPFVTAPLPRVPAAPPPVAAPPSVPPSVPPPVPPPVPVTPPPPAPPVAAAPVAVAPAATAPGPAPAGDAAARAFLAALGAGGNVTDAELLATMERLGHVLRVLIHGMREVLMTRTAIKSEFRIAQTMIGAGGNNPLKFSISPEQAVEAMVKPTTPGYLDALTAAEQALGDVKAHEIAMMTGMEAALKGILARLDPAALEGKIETSGGFGSILRGKKARYWEVYEKMYAEISDQAENDFHELFSREFARAYQAQLERLK